MLLTLTLITVAAVVLVLVVYLVLIIVTLRAALRSVAAIADGLEVVRGHTQALPAALINVNGGLSALHDGLRGCDRQLERTASLLGLLQRT